MVDRYMNNLFSDYWVDGVLKIANSKPLMEKYQGNVTFPDIVLQCQVKQILEANILLQKEWEKFREKTSSEGN
jgi:hypothetical protein